LYPGLSEVAGSLLQVTKVDLFALAFVALTALLGLKKGMIASALSVAGIVGGAFVGARLAPQLLTGGSSSPYTPLAGLAGAAFGALLLETLAAFVGDMARRGLPLPPLRMLDSIGGFMLGAASGLVLVWVVGASALLIPGQRNLRHAAQKSLVLQQLYAAVPPSSVLKILARVDPFPSIAGPLAPVAPPDPALLRSLAVKRVAPSVVRVLGTACGLRIAGSGWVAEPSLVVTAAHVVAGEDDTVVTLNRSTHELPATVVAFDQKNDVALLRVPELRARPLPLRKPSPGDAVAILGYPENGPLTVVPGRLGATSVVLSEDAYGHGPIARTITAVRGSVRHGNSGGPTVDSSGAVETTVFAARLGSNGGFGVPSGVVRKLLRRDHSDAVSTGDCAR
jgi:S1-C subfamily serine protease